MEYVIIITEKMMVVLVSLAQLVGIIYDICNPDYHKKKKKKNYSQVFDCWPDEWSLSHFYLLF